MKPVPMNQNNKRRPKREPLKTLGQLASELGMNTAQIRAHLAHSTVPKPVEVTLRRRENPNATWYRPCEFRAWWAAHKASLGRESP